MKPTDPSPAIRPAERLYSIADVARLWSTSRDTVERRMNAGELRWVMVGERRRIPESALADYLERDA